ncbi:class I SAM-dependent methyltransferase [Actinokineospora soli]|uniref:Class I SAM-dependent methyltransferase n=1 Tax=Actinokineospora soli TaxID=1048753 RepID=A0ABW2TPW3_9PSEU
MSHKQQVVLGEVQETLLIPLYGRAVEARKPRSVLRDPRSVEMVDSIDYDFAKLDSSNQALFACAMRTAIIDEWVRGFLAEHPSGTVVELGTGLNTRFDRVDNGTVRWIDIDLPDVIELRRAFFGDKDRYRMIAASITEDAWLDEVVRSGGPYLLVSEAVLAYLAEEDVRSLFRRVASRLPGAWVVTDTFSRMLVEQILARDVRKVMSMKMLWTCGDPREVERWGVGARLLETRNLGQPQAALRRRMPPVYRVGMAVADRLGGRRLDGYRLNLYKVAEPDK